MKIKGSKDDEKNKMSFDVNQLLSDIDPGFTTYIEDQKSIEKKFKNMNKISKFENFSNTESNQEDCLCCYLCTGELDCSCGCDDCKCSDIDGMEDVLSFDDFRKK